MTPEARTPADRLLEGGWLALALLVPLAINPWGSSVFSLPKAALLRALVVGLAAIWAADLVLGGRRPRRALLASPLLLPAAGLAAVIGLATLFAPAPELALWGSHGRGQGALTLWCFPLLALLVATRMRRPVEAQRLFWAATATAVPVAFYGSLQLAGPDPLGILTDARSPVFSTLGRANFLAAYAAMLTPLCVALVAATRRAAPRALAAGLGLLALALLVAARARAGWLAAAVALAFFAAAIHARRLRLLLRFSPVRVAATGLAAAATAGGLWLAQAGGSGAARLAIWQGTQKLVVERPLLGYGPDSLGLAFPRVYPPELVYYQGRGYLVDRAHNLILDWLATLGTLGVFAGAAFLAVVALSGWRRLARREEDEGNLLVIGALAALAGNLAGNLVSFDVLPTLTLSALLAGTVVALERPTAPPDAVSTARRDAPGKRVRWRPTAAILVLLAALAVAWAIAYRPVAADVLSRRSHLLAEAGRWEEAAAAAERAVATFPVEPTYRQRLGWIRLQWALGQPSMNAELLDAARMALETALARRPGDYLLATALAEYHTAVALRFDRRHLGPAEEAWERATTLAPNHGLLYLAWAKLRLQAGDPAGADPLLREAVDLDATDAEAWLLLGDLALGRNRPADALVPFRQAAAHAPARPEPLVGLARAYWTLGQPEAARETARQALALDPVNGAAMALLEEFDAAREEAVQTDSAAPSGRATEEPP